MEKHSVKADIFLTVVILIVACIGMGVVSSNRVHKDSGTITTENYSEYMDIECILGNGFGGSPYEVTYEYAIYVKAKPYRTLSNLEISLTLSSQYADFKPEWLTVSYVEPDKPFKQTGTVRFKYPSNYDFSYQQRQVNVRVVSASGSYGYINKRG